MKVSPLYVYRETTFPTNLMAPFFTNLAERWLEIDEKERRLRGEVKLATQRLEKEIKQVQSDKTRKSMINFKRSFFNLRKKAFKEYEALQSIFTEERRKEIEYVLRQHKMLELEKQQLEDQFDENYQNERETLQDIYKSELDLRNGVMFMNNAIEKKVEKYISTPIHEHTTNLRKLDYVLLNFLMRATLKTSPFANLTHSGIGEFNQKEISYDTKVLYPRVNDYLMLRVFDEICKDEAILPKLSYTVNKTLIHKDGKFYITVLQNADNTMLYKTKQNLFILDAKPIFQQVFERIQEEGALSYLEIISLFESKGVPDSAAEKVVKSFIQKGVLERTIHLNEQSEQLLQDVLSFLEEHGIHQEKQILLKEIHEKLTYLENGTLDYAIIRKVYRLINQLLESYSIELEDKKNLLYLDYINKQRDYQSLTEQGNLFANLHRYQWLVMALDPMVKIQYAIANFFLEKYGDEFIPENEREISQVLRDIAQVIFFDNDLIMSMYGKFDWQKEYSDQKTHGLHETSQSFVDYMWRHIGDEVIVLEDSVLEKATNDIRQITGEKLISHSFFIQHSGSQHVINHTYKGYSTFFARFLKYFGELGAEFEQYINEYFNENGITDIPNTFGFNANVRKQLTSKSFTLPIGATDSPGKSIDWQEIGFRYNENTHNVELFDKRNKQQIKPQYLGTLILVAVPSLVSALDMISSHGTIYYDLGNLLTYEYQRKRTLDRGVVRIPRIQSEDGEVIYSRAKWVFSGTEIQSLYKKDKRFESWKKVLDYFKENDIPNRFYCKPFLEDVEDITTGTKNYKPQFINLSSPILFLLFIQVIEKNPYIMIEEEFPIASEKEGYVKEDIYEITHKERVKDDLSNNELLSI
ncbi:lantibiotic dehydratase [Sediminibacillus sp. JSM 1682029]|uniref:lantibiotic dehydratase n=1 Tax=Sediminibacillus sp. JSM 1682029 TaxID=3229857 RepID=UPI003523DA5C